MSKNSVNNNDENLLEILGSRRLAGMYLAEFLRLYEHYRARAFAPGSNKDDGRLKTTRDAWARRHLQPGTPEFRARLAMTGRRFRDNLPPAALPEIVTGIRIGSRSRSSARCSARCSARSTASATSSCRRACTTSSASSRSRSFLRLRRGSERAAARARPAPARAYWLRRPTSLFPRRSAGQAINTSSSAVPSTNARLIGRARNWSGSPRPRIIARRRCSSRSGPST